MQKFIKKLIERLEDERKIAYNTYMNYEMNVDLGRAFGAERAIDIVNQLAEEYKVSEMPTGWIPCDKELPPMPKENPLFENKPLELYLVSLNSTDYPWRAFWNGKFFTDGWSKVEVIAWMPLPAPYQQKEGE